jgi:sugar lactone lactonase YvrE
LALYIFDNFTPRITHINIINLLLLSDKMKQRSTQIYLLLLLIIPMLSACFKNGSGVELPVVLTGDVVIEATSTSAWTGGSITNSTSNFTMYGVCYSTTNPEPTVNDTKTEETIKLLSFNSHLTGLTPNTVYYVRAYVTNSTGTGYGNVIQFKTGSDLSASYGTVSTFAGSSEGFENGTGTAALFNRPTAVATDAAGNVYVSDSFNSVIRKITPDGVSSTLAGSGTFGYADGPAATAQFYVPSGLAVDAAGNVFVADLGNNMIRKISPTGVVSTFAGNGSAGYSDGTGTSSTFNAPTGVALDAAGNLYVTDSGNSLIRQITPAGAVTTVVGNRLAAFANGIGTAASLNKPSGIAFDAAGNMYVTEPLNKAIRKIAKDYTVTTFTGGLDSVSLAIGKPQAINIDANNNIYIADGNGRILKINKDKILTVLAGKTGGTGSTDGDGSTALFNSPQGVASDTQGNVYIADYNNNRIRKIK